MESIMEQFLNLYGKYDEPSYGRHEVTLEEVADALGYVQGFDCDMRPYYRTLHELTNEYLVENREFIAINDVNDRISFKTRVYNKHAFLFLVMLCGKHRKRNWLDNERLMKDHKTYFHRIIGITDRKDVEGSSEDSEGYAPCGNSDDTE